MPENKHRRSIRLKDYDYTQPGGYSITIVTYQRECLFGEIMDGEMRLNDIGQVAKKQWEKLAQRFPFVELGAFVVMPNHIHSVIIIHERRGTAENGNQNNLETHRRAPTTERFGKPIARSIPTIIRSYKSAVTLCINLMRQTESQPIWQSNYYEHIIRNQTDWAQIDAYIKANPAMWDDNNENLRM
jgi:putative transposase